MTTDTLAAPRAAASPTEAGFARIWIARLLAAFFGANAFYMIADAAGWYRAVPGVTATGPLNAHFVVDIGIAYLAAAVALAVGSLRPARLAGLALPAAVFIVGHAIFHLVGHGAHEAAESTLGADIAAIYVPALLALWLVLPAPPRGVLGAALSGRFYEAMVRLGEKKLGVTLDYLRDIAAGAPRMFRLLGRVSALGQSIRPQHLHATHLAALGAALHDDCGTCVQIHINLARADGVAEDVLRHAVAGEAEALPEPLADAFRFGAAVAANDEAMHPLRETLEQSLGKRSMIEMAVAIAFARFYPTVKRALGHARSCAVLRFDFGRSTKHG